ncbi:MAG: hypothetical protein E7354_02525 [Clostridiales bacterium]|nr:hypothetical protein [Clostridiales bacterium]
MNEFNIEQVEKLRIHELRDYARTVGVPSPTTMKKQELISKISEIFENKESSITSHRGEEELDFFSLLTSDKSSIFNKLLDRASKPDKKTDKPTFVDNNTKPTEKVTIKAVPTSADEPYKIPNRSTYSWSVSQNEATYSSQNETMSGYLDIHPDGYGIVRKNGYVPDDEDVYITESLIKKQSLKKGMYIKGKIKTIVVGKPKIMYEIDYNDIVAYKAKWDYEQLPYSPIGDTLYLDKNKFEVKQGERLYCKGLDIKDCVGIAEELADENSCYTKVINFRARPEDDFQSNQKMEIINCPFNKTEIAGLNTIELVVERVKREAEIGRPTVLFLYGFSEMIRSFNVAIEGFYDFSKMNAKAINKVKNILYTAKNTLSNLYITIVCVDKNGIPSDMENMMNLEILPLFNTIR